jgi:lipopolysaccharide transport system ATP-binding protein
MPPLISVESLGKEYVIGAAAGKHGTLREAVMNTFKSPARMFGHRAETTVWALRDLSFTASPGDVIGVIGKNGAGKSTLLKILSRITEPTTGRAQLYGRVGSLLEVGTGFHQDLTGRENVYLNGAILGMKRAEISSKFHDIVAFAEVERFIDTPVKHYSSGMYLRLAFAVAAFLESEILLVDEVLAVGDVSFQKRCLGKMREVSASGRTVLFVSHTMAAIEALCNRCLYIADGRLAATGTPHDVIGRYMSAEIQPRVASISLEQHSGRRAGSAVFMRGVALTGDRAEPAASIRMGTGLSIRVAYESDRIIAPVLGVVIKNNYGAPLFGVNNRLVPGFEFVNPSRAGEITCHLSSLPLMPDTYSIDLYFGDAYTDYDVVYDAATFEVVSADVFGSGKLPGSECGSICWPGTWTHTPAGATTASGAVFD